MRFVLVIAAGMAALAAGWPLAQASASGMTTASLAEACANEGRDMAGATEVGYCRGFMTGAGQYDREIYQGRSAIFCMPDPSPTFEAAQASFVAWARANPQFANELAVDGLMRWAAATYPCPAQAAQPARRPLQR
ncbi:MAG: Rap1a/Tai family immunity protein [Rhodopila sp.]|jgi:hypothetical protein